MANDYYQAQFSGVPHGLAKTEQIVESLNAIEAGFERLPALRPLLEDRVTAAVATGGPNAYVVNIAHPPAAYTDGMALNVRFPTVNAQAPTLDLQDMNGVALGAKPIRQVDGTTLSAGHIAADARAELYYVGVGQGYWVLGAGARGARGQAGPPDGVFSLNASKELVFTPGDSGDPTNLGRVAPLYKGTYDAAVEYVWLDIVRTGRSLYLHTGLMATTGTATTDATVWQRLADPGADAGVVMEFRTATSQGDPGDGRMRYNSATLSSVTRIWMDNEDADGNDMSAWIDLWDNYGADPNAHIVVRELLDRSSVSIFALTQVVALTGYRRLDVTHVAGSTRPTNGGLVSVTPLLRGNTGQSGVNTATASTSTKGLIEIATGTEADTGTDTSRAMTPALVKRRIDALSLPNFGTITAFRVLTQAQYDAIVTKSSTTLYFVSV